MRLALHCGGQRCLCYNVCSVVAKIASFPGSHAPERGQGKILSCACAIMYSVLARDSPWFLLSARAVFQQDTRGPQAFHLSKLANKVVQLTSKLELQHLKAQRM